LLNNIPDTSGSTQSAVAIFNPATQSLDWVLRLNITLISDLQVVEESTGNFSIWISSMWGDLIKIDPDGNVLESYKLNDLSGSRNGSASSAGLYNYGIMKMAWSIAYANTLYLAVRTFSTADDGYGFMLMALNISNGIIIQHALAFTLAGSGYVSGYPGYEIRGLTIGSNGNLWLVAYDQGSHRMAFMNFTPALALISAFSSPFFWLDFNAFAAVNGYLLMAGSSLVTGCDNCPTFGYMDIANPGVVFLYTFLNPSLPWYLYRVFTGILVDCPEGEKTTSSACPVILSGHEFNYYTGKTYNPFLISIIPDSMNISTAERKLVKNDTGKANGVTKSKGGVVMTYGSSGRYAMDKTAWFNLSLWNETNSCQSTEIISSASQSFTLDNVTIEEDTGAQPFFDIHTIIAEMINPFFSSSCPRNCDLTADMLLYGGDCKGSTLTCVSASYGNPGPAYYAWKFSDGTIIQGTDKASIMRTVNDTGQLIVTLVVSDDFACVDSISDTIYVCPAPKVGISMGDPKICLDSNDIDTLVFLDVSSSSCDPIISRTWKDDGNIVGHGSSYKGYYKHNDTVAVTLIVETLHGCIDSTSVFLTYQTKPKIDSVTCTVTDSIPCTSKTLLFSSYVSEGSSGIASYKWTLINSSNETLSGNSGTIEITATESETWIYTLVVTDSNGCVDSISGTCRIEIGKGPTALFDHNAPQCFNKSAGFTTISFTDRSLEADAPIVEWQWDFGDGSLPNAKQNTSHNFTAPGTYDVSLTVKDANGCQSSTVQTVIIYKAPTAGIGAPPYWCLGLPLQFQDKSVAGDFPINAWNWTFGDGNISTQQNPTHSYSITGTGIPITLQVTDTKGCSDFNGTTLDIISLLASISGDTEGCQDEALNFQGSVVPSGNNYTWNWSFGDGSSDTRQNPNHSYQSKGNYTVQLIVTEPGGICSDSATHQVSIYAKPDAYFAGDTFCALLDSVLFRDSSTADPGNPINYWAWFFEDDTLYGKNVYYHPNDTAERQWITHTVNTVKNCSDTYSDSIDFIIDSLINPGFKYSTNNLTVTFTDTTRNSISRDWDFGDGTFLKDTSRIIEHTYAIADTYKLRLIIRSYCDRDTIYYDFKLVPSGIKNIPGFGYKIEILPNPNNGHFHLLVKSEKLEPLDISLYDLRGRLLYHEKGKISKDVENWDFDISAESKGLYILKISGPGGSGSRLLIYQ